MKREGSFWPAQLQEVLLRAALCEGKDAVEAWKEWRSRVDIDDIDRLDPGSYRLLPLLYHNLKNKYPDDPLMMRLKGVYRLTWYKNQMLFHAIASVLRSFRRAGIDAMVLKGAALTLLCYRDYGLRPMNDFDVLVHTGDALSAVSLLRELGWTSLEFDPDEKYISVSYSHGFADKSGREFDLHWHLFSQCRTPGADDDYWKDAALTDFHGVPAYVLSPTDQLLHVCVHGAEWNITPPFRWVADAMMLLRNAQDGIDWDSLISRAAKRQLTLPLLDTLQYLRETFDAQVPPEVLRKLANIPVPWIERMEYRIAINPPTPWSAALDLWCQHSRLAGGANLPRKAAGFPKFLQSIWGISAWKLPFHSLMKTIQYGKMRRASPDLHRGAKDAHP
jgi:hypothetical protein